MSVFNDDRSDNNIFFAITCLVVHFCVVKVAAQGQGRRRAIEVREDRINKRLPSVPNLGRVFFPCPVICFLLCAQTRAINRLFRLSTAK